MKTLLSIDRTVRILDIVVEHPCEYTLSELSKILDVPISTLHGFCATLEYWQLLQKDAFGRFTLGYRLLHYAFSTNEQQLCTAVHPYLMCWMEQFNETFHLGVLQQDHVIYIDKAEPNKPYRMTSVIGCVDPYYASAIGLVLLARRGVDIPAEYLTNCNDIRKDGYCLKFEPDMNAYCLGVALKGIPDNNAAISVVIPTHRCTPDFVHTIVSTIQSAPPRLAC